MGPTSLYYIVQHVLYYAVYYSYTIYMCIYHPLCIYYLTTYTSIRVYLPCYTLLYAYTIQLWREVPCPRQEKETVIAG